MSKPKPPESLAAAGREVWTAIVAKYELRPDELRTLEDACATTDMIEALSVAWADLGKPLTTRGSMGQEVIHPLIGEIRTQRSARNKLWAQLKLPEDGTSTGATKTNPARAAADTRWKHGS